MKDIIERLNDPETCIDAIDDAIAEIERLRKLVQARRQAVLDLRVMAVGLSKATTPPTEKTLHAISAEIKRLCDVIEQEQA
jgi:hypothetical protein